MGNFKLIYVYLFLMVAIPAAMAFYFQEPIKPVIALGAMAVGIVVYGLYRRKNKTE